MKKLNILKENLSKYKNAVIAFSVDLSHYRSGSMNEVLSESEKKNI
ncbi:MAG TPA: hypothetical protein VMV47_11685 [Bacteroidales bacterium]|nr:hypothetical protein [Bacteroidales bacterium]